MSNLSSLKDALKDFKGHGGRPGKVGGSVPRGGGSSGRSSSGVVQIAAKFESALKLQKYGDFVKKSNKSQRKGGQDYMILGGDKGSSAAKNALAKLGFKYNRDYDQYEGTGVDARLTANRLAFAPAGSFTSGS